MEAVVWEWGPFSLPVFSLTFFAGVLAGLCIFFAEGRRKLLPDNRIIDFMILSLVTGIAGSRLTYCILFNFDFYRENPVFLFRLQDGGMSFWGGVIPAFLVILIWGARKGLVVGRYLDCAAPAVIFGWAVGNVGAYLHGNVMPAGYTWGIHFDEVSYHPDGAYAILLSMILFTFIWRRRRRNVYEGSLFAWFLMGSSVINLLLDFFRETETVAGMLSPGQLVSLLVLAVTAFFMIAGSHRSLSAPYMSRYLEQPSRLAVILLLLWLVMLTAAMITLYYFAQQLMFTA